MSIVDVLLQITRVPHARISPFHIPFGAAVGLLHVLCVAPFFGFFLGHPTRCSAALKPRFCFGVTFAPVDVVIFSHTAKTIGVAQFCSVLRKSVIIAGIVAQSERTPSMGVGVQAVVL